MPTRVEHSRLEFRQGGHVFPENPELDALMRQLETSVSYARFGADLTPTISGEYDCGTVAKPWRGMTSNAVECVGTSTFRQGVMQIREKGVIDFGTNTSMVVLPVYTEGTSPFDLWHPSSEYLRDGAIWLQKGSPVRLMLRAHGEDRIVGIWDTTTSTYFGTTMWVRTANKAVTFSTFQYPDTDEMGCLVTATCTMGGVVSGSDRVRAPSNFAWETTSESLIIGEGAGVLGLEHMTAVGHEAGVNCAEAFITAIGRRAAYDNSGASVTAVGRNAAQGNSATSVTVVGRSSGADNVGDALTAVGLNAATSNTGTEIVAVGKSCAFENEGNGLTAVGARAGWRQVGTEVTALGFEACYQNGVDNVADVASVVGVGKGAAFRNQGISMTALGRIAGYQGIGDDCVCVGRFAGYQMSGDKCTALGRSSFKTFSKNTGGAKTFNYDDVNPATDYITCTSHGFGATNEFVHLHYASGTGTVPGLDNDTAYQCRVISADLIWCSENITGQGDADDHTLTPRNVYSNSTAIGYNTEPDASNQCMVGDANLTEIKSVADVNLDGGHLWAHLSGGGEHIGLRLGELDGAATTSAYDFITDDDSGDILEIHSNRWGYDVQFSRGSAGGDLPCARIYGTGDHLFDLYDDASAIKVRLNSNGISYFMGGNLGVNTTTADTDLQVVGACKFGDDNTNYASFAADGELTLTGTARVEKYMTIGAGALAKGSTAPTNDLIGTFPVLLFQHNGTASASYTVHIPPDWAVGTDIEVAIYWAPTTDSAGDGVAWEFDWEARAHGEGAAGEILGAGSTHVEIHDTTYTGANNLQETGYGTISGASLAADDSIGITISRVHDDPFDDYGADAALVHVEVEYIADKLGEAT